MAFKVFKSDSGTTAGLWVVADYPSGEVMATAKSNSAAWNAADKMANEATTAIEYKLDFVKAVEVKENKEQWFGAFLTIAKNKDRSIGWAAFSFKAKFGHWPDGIPKTPLPVFPAVSMFLRDRAANR